MNEFASEIEARELSPESPGIAMVLELERLGVLTRTGLRDLPWDLSFDRFEALCGAFGTLHETSRWALADLLNMGERIYGETYAQVEQWTGLNRDTLYKYASIGKYVPRSARRTQLPMSLHAEVAYRPPKERDDWLKRAVEGDWKREEMREHLRHDREQKAIQAAIESGEPLPAVAVEVFCTCPTCGNEHHA